MAGVNFIAGDVTVADMEDFEEKVGVPLIDALQAVDEGEQKDTKVLTGLIWIAARREDPALTFEDARHLPLSTLTISENREARRARPTKAAPKKSGSKSKTASKKRA